MTKLYYSYYFSSLIEIMLTITKMTRRRIASATSSNDYSLLKSGSTYCHVRQDSLPSKTKHSSHPGFQTGVEGQKNFFRAHFLMFQVQQRTLVK